MTVNTLSIKKASLVLLVLGLVTVTGGSLYLYRKTAAKLALLQTPQGKEELAKKEVADTVKKLSKLTLVPGDEQPVVADILDPVFLASQSAFYEQAKEGDQLIIFSKAKRAYIYRPQENILVNSGPLLITEPEATLNQSQPEQSPVASKFKLEIRNGSNTVGKATQIGARLKETYDVIGITDAANKEYPKTMVIPLNAAVPETALQNLADQVDGTVNKQQPTTEQNSSADVLIIMGNN